MKPTKLHLLLCTLLIPGQLAAQSPEGVAPAPPEELTPAEQKAAYLRLPTLDRSAMNPELREPLEVVDEERNPFGMVALAAGERRPVEVIKAESEEQKIRRVLANMRISGLAGSPGAYRVLIGSLPVGEGDILPRLFADQAEKLLVKSISDRAVALEFIESDESVAPRTIGLSLDLRPQVNSLLPGEMFLKLVPFDAETGVALPPRMADPVAQVLESLEAVDAASLVERTYELLNAPAVLGSDERKSDRTR